MSVIDISRRKGETELGYIKRLGEAKDAGLLDMTWQELAGVFNKNLREPGVEWNESTYRKKFAALRDYSEEFGTANKSDADELISIKRELEKEKVKLRDERTEYKRLIREEARKESYQEQFIRAIEEAAGKHPLDYDASLHHQIIRGASVVVAPLTDVHMGIQISNYWNKYDEDVLRQMMKYYLDYIENVAIRHGAEDVVVLASELVSGLIHPAIRLQNNQDLIEQFLNVTDYICDFLAVLSLHFNTVEFYVAPGNHGRINPKKDDGLAHENMDELVVPFVKSRLQSYPNIHCYSNEVDSGIVTTTVLKSKLVFVHGDKDDMSNVTKNMTKLLGYTPDIIIMGHRHFNAYTTDNTTKIIQSGSFMGPDEYSISKRLVGKPEQTVFVINNNGLECIYDMRL